MAFMIVKQSITDNIQIDNMLVHIMHTFRSPVMLGSFFVRLSSSTK